MNQLVINWSKISLCFVNICINTKYLILVIVMVVLVLWLMNIFYINFHIKITEYLLFLLPDNMKTVSWMHQQALNSKWTIIIVVWMFILCMFTRRQTCVCSSSIFKSHLKKNESTHTSIHTIRECQMQSHPNWKVFKNA